MKLLIALFLFPLVTFANSIPVYLQGQPNKEYLKTLHKLEEFLPEKGSSKLLLMLASPYEILDIQPTKFSSKEDRNLFANFNLGVVGSIFSELEANKVSKLPELVLCKKGDCKSKRLAAIKNVMSSTKEIEFFFKANPDINVVQQLNENVYRINNAFFTPTSIMQFTPSETAGFVPSANAINITDFSAQPYARHVKHTDSLRKLMNRLSIIAIVKEKDTLISVIFGGISNNQWGIKLAHHASEKPVVGETNYQGFKYDDVQKLSDHVYYYQTN